MILRMFKRWKSILAGGVLIVSMMPGVARAQDEENYYDARLEGHSDKVTLPGGSTALMWLTLAGLGILCVGVTFKAGKRSHLD